jgi:hypothetical protein
MSCQMCNYSCPCGPCGLDGPMGPRGSQGNQGPTGVDGNEISVFGTIYHSGCFETSYEIPMRLYSCCFNNVKFPFNSQEKTIKLQVELGGCYLINYNTSAVSNDDDYCIYVEGLISGPIENSYFTGNSSAISHTFLANLQAGETLCLKIENGTISNFIKHITANLSVFRLSPTNL